MRKETAFTLIELLVTLAVLAVVTTLAIPDFRSMIMSNRLATQLNDFVVSLQIARSEAVKQGVETTVCKSADSASCTTAGNWEQGWVVFIDLDDDEQVDAGEIIINVGNALGGGNTLIGNANVDDVIKFDSRGFSQGYNGTLTLCDSRGATLARGLVISNTGRVRRTIDNNDDGTEEDGAGVALACP